MLILYFPVYTVIRFVSTSAKFGTCTAVSVNGTLVDKMRTFKDECSHFSFNKCRIYTHDGTSAKLSTNSHETDNSTFKRTNSCLKLTERANVQV
jgi:hypothetical protein